MKVNQKFLKKKLPAYIKFASQLSLVVGVAGVGQVFAADVKGDAEEVVVTGLRASAQSAQEIKKNSNAVVDSIVAEDIGKLPDRSVTDSLQRVPGVTVSRYDTANDPEHFAGEGSHIAVRGLTQVRSELNGGDIFSASDARGLSFEDVPAELMAGVDVYKSPTADMIEGGLGGTVNLRTRKPFDSAGQVVSVTVKGNYGDQIKEFNGEGSALYSNRWETSAGEFGVLVDLASSKLSSRADNLYTRAFIKRDDLASYGFSGTHWVPRGADWRRNDFHRTREGEYLAVQWAPSENLELSYTVFRSSHDQRWNENAFFLDQHAGIYAPLPVSGANDWVFDKNNALVSGTTTTQSNLNGISFGTSTRLSDGVSNTADRTLAVKWTPTDHLKIDADLQRVQSDSHKEDYTLGLIVFPHKVAYTGLDSGTSIGVDPTYMQNYANYSFGQMMAILSRNSAELKAGKVDAEYSFDDSIIKSVKAGARFATKTADNRDGNSWAARYQPWQVGTDGWQAYTSDSVIPKVNEVQAWNWLDLYNFGSFQRGNATVPTQAYLIKASKLKDFKATTDAITAMTPGGCCTIDWTQNANLDYPGNGNVQEEKTQSAYVMTNFGFDNLSTPIDGNLGVRFVKTTNSSQGHLTYSSFQLSDAPKTKPFYAPEEDFSAENSYTNVLPSLNLRLKVTDEFFVRLAASKAIWAPEFSQLKARIGLDVALKDGNSNTPTVQPDSYYKFTSNVTTNPYLEPMKANQLDLSTEWYFDEHGGMAHLALFKKDVTDFFRQSTGSFERNGHTYTTQWIGNVGQADIKGAEVGVTKFFDKLPAPFDGLGVEANFTYIDSKTKVPDATKPVDVDGSSYGPLPLEGLSKTAYNLVGIYEKDGISARLAYNWRSKYLVAVGPNGWNPDSAKLPIYNDAYGQLDASIGYTFKENYTVTFEAANLTKAETKGTMDQNAAGDHTAYVYSQDVRYAVSLRAKF